MTLELREATINQAMHRCERRACACATPANMTDQRTASRSSRIPGTALRWLAAWSVAIILACSLDSEADSEPLPNSKPSGLQESSESDSTDVSTSDAAGDSVTDRVYASDEEFLATLDASLGFSRDAKFDSLRYVLDEANTAWDPSDGGGRAWIERVKDRAGDPLVPRAGGLARIHLTYEAGPQGISNGGALYFQVSSYWEWDLPQNIQFDAPGYTEARCTAEGVELELNWLESEILEIKIRGRGLVKGEKIELIYGAGPALARMDRFAETRARLWFLVDGDGDGVAKRIADSPGLDIGPGDPARLVVVVPSSARPGDEIQLTLSVLDHDGNTGVSFEGSVSIKVDRDGLEVPGQIEFSLDQLGRRSVPIRVAKPGVYRISAIAYSPQYQLATLTTSNPLVVREGIPRLRWTDLHGHSQFSDGTGTPADYFLYARDVAGLDVVSLTDHDHWGENFLDENPKLWEVIRHNVERFHDPGKFVTLLGYEWTSWIHGHRHVIYFKNEGEVLSMLESRYETPAQLWNALKGKSALTFAHHSAGGPVSTNWAYRPDPAIEPVTEIVSIHGSSEATDSPGLIYNPLSGNFVRDVLDAGMQFGFIGSSDSHDGHPGQAQLASSGGSGLAAVFSEELSRVGIRNALLARNVYATTGARIWLEVEIDGHPMGSSIPFENGEGGEDSRDTSSGEQSKLQRLHIYVVAESPLMLIDIVRSGSFATIHLQGELEWTEDREIPPLQDGEYLYIRVIQRDLGAAWSSPIFGSNSGAGE